MKRILTFLLCLAALSAVAGTTIIDDTFTGSAGNLTGHTGPNGEVWVSAFAGSDFELSSSGTVYQNNSGNALYCINNKFGISVNQTVSLKIAVKTALSDIVGIYGWSDNPQMNAYVVLYQPGSPNTVQLYKIVLGSPSSVGSAHTVTIGNGDTLSLALNTASQIILVNGSPVGTTTDTSVTQPLPSALFSGMYFATQATSTTGTHADEFSVVDNSLSLTNNAPQILTQSKTSVTLASQPSGGSTPYTYQWYASTTPSFIAGGGNILSGQTASNLTISVTSARQFVRVIVTDASSSTLTSFQRTIEAARDNSLSIASLGDSTGVEPGYGTNACDVMCALIATRGGFTTVNNFNECVSGSDTFNWLPGQPDMIAYSNAVKTITNRWVQSFGVGVNDGQAGHSTNTFYQNYTNILLWSLTLTNALGQHPFATYLHYPTWREPGLFTAAGPVTFDETYAPVIYSYLPFIGVMVNNSNVFLGDTASLDLFAQYPLQYMAQGGTEGGGDVGAIGSIHPSPHGAWTMGINRGESVWQHLYSLFYGAAY